MQSKASMVTTIMVIHGIVLSPISFKLIMYLQYDYAFSKKIYNYFLAYFFKYKLYPANSKPARKINSGKAVAAKLNFKSVFSRTCVKFPTNSALVPRVTNSNLCGNCAVAI